MCARVCVCASLRGTRVCTLCSCCNRGGAVDGPEAWVGVGVAFVVPVVHEGGGCVGSAKARHERRAAQHTCLHLQCPRPSPEQPCAVDACRRAVSSCCKCCCCPKAAKPAPPPTLVCSSQSEYANSEREQLLAAEQEAATLRARLARKEADVGTVEAEIQRQIGDYERLKTRLLKQVGGWPCACGA